MVVQKTMKVKNDINARIILAFFGLLCFFGLILVLFWYQHYHSDTSVITHIESMQTGANKFIDFDHEIEVSGPEDIGYTLDATGVMTIYYGKQVIRVSPTARKDKTFMAELKKIGIEIKQKQVVSENKTTTVYKVLYWGTAVNNYVRKDGS
jgi:hypothetical protein